MAMSFFRVNLDNLKTTVAGYCSGILGKITTILNRLNAHTTATGNVHRLEPQDIGLGNVPDWTPATQKQAQQGISNNAFMTPKRVSDYVDANVFQVIGDAFESAADDL